MEERKLRLIEGTNSPSEEKRKFLITEKMLSHIENKQLKLKKINATPKHVDFTFVYKTDKKDWEIDFSLELIIDTIIIEFDGGIIPDQIRMIASKILEKTLESIRFIHKDKFWEITHYYLEDSKEYRTRLTRDYALKVKENWNTIKNMAKIEALNDDDYLYIKLEDAHEKGVFIVGEDGKKLCEVLREFELIQFEKIAENEYEIILLDDSTGIEKIKRQIVIGREISKYGYSVLVDYKD